MTKGESRLRPSFFRYAFVPVVLDRSDRVVGHFVENTGNDTLHFLEIFRAGQRFQFSLISIILMDPNADRFQDISLQQVMLPLLPSASPLISI